MNYSKYSINIGIICVEFEYGPGKGCFKSIPNSQYIRNLMQFKNMKVNFKWLDVLNPQQVIKSSKKIDCILMCSRQSCKANFNEYRTVLEEHRIPYFICIYGSTSGVGCFYKDECNIHMHICDGGELKKMNSLFNSIIYTCKYLKLYHILTSSGWFRNLPNDLTRMLLYFKNKKLHYTTTKDIEYSVLDEDGGDCVPSKNKIYLSLVNGEYREYDSVDVIKLYIRTLFTKINQMNFKVITMIDTLHFNNNVYKIKLDFVKPDQYDSAIKILHHRRSRDDPTDGIKFSTKIKYYIIKNIETLDEYKLKYNMLRFNGESCEILDRTQTDMLITTDNIVPTSTPKIIYKPNYAREPIVY